jgi:hypothetical protein
MAFSSPTARALFAAALAAPLAAAAQTAAPPPPAVIGRWDLTVTGPAGPYPSWLEVALSGNSTLVGRFVGGVGSARPIGRVEYAGDTLRFAIPPQWEKEAGDLRVEGTLAGERLAGTLVTPGGERHTWTAVRAPALGRPTEPRWGAPTRLFNGRDLAGWTTRGGENRWRVVNGVLTNAGGGGNLVTTRTFGDFKLQAEFRYPKGSNSGLYLRGRYEVQIEDGTDGPEPGPMQMGGVYGFLAPNENAAGAPGAWQRYTITLVGRRVTVVLNGRTVIANAVIPGITGGALDSNEGAPGPLMIQGDHGAVEFRRIVITPAASQ